MRRDTIFYRLFAQHPQLLFQLLDQPPNNPETYRFDSVSIKEPTFTIDGVFLPPDNQPPSTVFFAEVQFQKDKYLYERLFSESFLYFYRNRDRFSDWQAILIYPSRSTEQTDTQPYSDLLNGPRVHRIYLNELGDLQTLPPEIALMVLTTLEAPALPDQAKALVTRTQQSQLPEPRQRDIIEMVTTILVYQFTHLSRQEVRAMLGITEVTLQDTRFYQEIKEEGREEGLQEGRQEGLQEGRQESLRSLLLLLLSQKFSPLPNDLQTSLTPLSPEQLEALAVALLTFSQYSDVETWLQPELSKSLIQKLTKTLGELPEDLQQTLKTQPLPRLTQLVTDLETIDRLETLQRYIQL